MSGQVFEAKIHREFLREALGAILAISDSGRLNISPEALSVRMTDPANVALISFDLELEAFEVYNFAPPEDAPDYIQIGVDFQKLASVLAISSAEFVSISLKRFGSAKETDQFPEVNLMSLKMDGLSYSLDLFDPSIMRKEPQVPELELPAKASLFFEDWYKAIRAAEKVGDVVLIKVDESGLVLEVEGESDKLRASFPASLLMDFTPAEVTARFALGYLSVLSKAARAAYASQLWLSLGRDMPIEIQFHIAEGKGHVVYWLAPRVE